MPHVAIPYKDAEYVLEALQVAALTAPLPGYRYLYEHIYNDIYDQIHEYEEQR